MRIRKHSLITFVVILWTALAQLGNAQWIQQQSGTRVRLNDVVMLDSMTAIAVGSQGVILKTTNAGQSWIVKSDSLITRLQPHWNALAFATPLLGVAVGNQESAAITTDGGETWPIFFTGGTILPRNWLSVAFASQTRLIIGDDSGGVRITNDGGITWQVMRFSSAPISDIFFSSGGVGYAVTPQLTYKTTNLGATWRSEPLPLLPLSGIRRGDCSPDANAYVVGFMGDFTTTPLILYRTAADTGWRVWLFMPPLPIGGINDISAPTSGTAYACGTTSLIFKTTNAGQFWGIGGMGFRRTLNAINFLNDRRGFVVGDSGAIFFTANGGGRAIHFFNLLSPRNGDTLRVGDTLRYRWERARDLDPDTTWYQLFISTNGGIIWQYLGGTVDTVSMPLPVPQQGRYWWTVRASDGSNTMLSEEVFSFVTRTTTHVKTPENPYEFALHQNYPNPFNPTTSISYDLPRSSFVRLKVFNLLGQEVARLVEGVEEAGAKSTSFDASKLASGIYIYRIEVEGVVAARKLLLLR